MSKYNVFVAYDRLHADFCHQIIAYLKAMPWGDLNITDPDIWHDSRVESGEWDPQIRDRIKKSDAIVLLMSCRYFGLPYVKQHEWPAIQQRLSQVPSVCLCFPILIESVPWRKYPEISKYVILPSDSDAGDPDTPPALQHKPEPRPIVDFPREVRSRLLNSIGEKIFEGIKKSLGPRTPSAILPSAPIDWVTHYSPSYPTVRGYVGRAVESQKLQDAMSDDSVAAVGIIGSGGLGKSTLFGHWLHHARQSGQLSNSHLLAYTFSPPTSEGAPNSGSFFSEALYQVGVRKAPDCQTGPEPESEIRRAQQLLEFIHRCAKETGRPTIVILDGVDVLRQQIDQPPGDFNDPAMSTFISLIGREGLPLGCKIVLTSRFAIKELEHRRTQPEILKEAAAGALFYVAIELPSLSNSESKQLLYSSGIDSNVFPETEMDVFMGGEYLHFGGNPLALILYAGFVRAAYQGDPKSAGFSAGEFGRSDSMEYYIKRSSEWLDRKHPAALLFLRCLGLVHRPLREQEYDSIQHSDVRDIHKRSFHDLLPGSGSPEFGEMIELLEKKMQLVNTVPGGWVCHALARDAFAEDFERSERELWENGHRILFEYFKSMGVKAPYRSKEDLEPLYRSVIHGCLAGRLGGAFQVYWEEIHRGEEAYSTNTLGNHSRDLSALAGFFEKSVRVIGAGKRMVRVVNWRHPRMDLPDEAKEKVSGVAAFCLHSVGLIKQAIDAREAQLVVLARRLAMTHSYQVDSFIARGQLEKARIGASYAHKLVEQFGDELWAERVESLSRLGTVQHLMGNLRSAKDHFDSAEQLLNQHKDAKWGERPRPPGLYSLPGSRWWELQLAMASSANVLEEIEVRVSAVESWLDQGGSELGSRGESITWLLDRALVSLAHGKIAARLGKDNADEVLRQAIKGIWISGQMDQVPSAWLARAQWRRQEPVGEHQNDTGAMDDAKRALEIAARYELHLHQVDAKILISELYIDRGDLPTARSELAEAKRLFRNLTEGRYDRARIRLEFAEAQLEFEESKIGCGSLPQCVWQGGTKTLDSINGHLHIVREAVKAGHGWIEKECLALQLKVKEATGS